MSWTYDEVTETLQQEARDIKTTTGHQLIAGVYIVEAIASLNRARKLENTAYALLELSRTDTK